MVDVRVPMWRTQPMQQHRTGPVVPPPAGKGSGEPDPAKDEPLGEPGLKALQAERERVDALKAALQAIQGGGDAAAAAEASAAKAIAQRDAESAKLAQLQAQLQTFEDKGKTDEQKRAEMAAKLAAERDTATVRAMRYEVCEAKDLPLAAARFLTGATKAEIEEAADAFKALGVATGAKPGGLPPAPNSGREEKKPSGAAAGLAEAQRRFGKPA